MKSCEDRASTRRGSTLNMTKYEVFSGILSNDRAMNPGAISTFQYFNLLLFIFVILILSFKLLMKNYNNYV